MTEQEEVASLRDAATIMVLRDGESGPEVFMVQRTSKASFMPNAQVYPGGALDDEDTSESAWRCVEGLTPDEALSSLGEQGEPAHALGLFLAGVRETFEEAGLLLAKRRGEDGFIDLTSEPSVATRFQGHRRQLRSGAVALSEFAEYERLVIPLDRVRPWARWITPYVEPKRFDARFFVVRAPESQEPLHDDQETVASEWVRPADVLARYARGECVLVPPTLATLTELAEFDSVDAILEAAPGRPHVFNLPHFIPTDDGMALVLPGDPEYPVDDEGFPADSPEGSVRRMILGEDRIWRIVE